MKRSSHKQKRLSILLVLALFLSVVSGTATVWAYMPLEITNFITEPDYSLGKVYADSSDIDFSFEAYDEIDFSASDNVLVNDDGSTVPFSPTTDEARKNCSHKKATKKNYIHETHANGGCTVKTYSLTYCTICHTVFSRELIGTANQPVCTHK